MHTTIEINSKSLDVEFIYERDEGCYTMSNGDPGWPPSESFEIISIELEGKCYRDVLERFRRIYKRDLEQEIEQRILDKM